MIPIIIVIFFISYFQVIHFSQIIVRTILWKFVKIKTLTRNNYRNRCQVVLQLFWLFRFICLKEVLCKWSFMINRCWLRLVSDSRIKIHNQLFQILNKSFVFFQISNKHVRWFSNFKLFANLNAIFAISWISNTPIDVIQSQIIIEIKLKRVRLIVTVHQKIDIDNQWVHVIDLVINKFFENIYQPGTHICTHHIDRLSILNNTQIFVMIIIANSAIKWSLQLCKGF